MFLPSSIFALSLCFSILFIFTSRSSGVLISFLSLVLYAFMSYFCMYFILLSTVYPSFFLTVFPTCSPVFLLFLSYSGSSTHPFCLAPSPPPYPFLFPCSPYVYFSPIINDTFLAPCVIFVTLLPYFILSLCGWSIRSRCPGGR